MNVVSHYDLTDDQFAAAFAACTMDPALFTHEAHLRLAWISISWHGVDKAVAVVCEQLKRFVAFAGAADKYNETVTVAAVKAVHYFMQRYPEKQFRDFLIKAHRLKTNFRDLMASHYSTDIFRLDDAKRTYLEPDLAKFE